jgi:hypothetical protein
MDDLKDRLAALGERITDDPEAFERLRAHRNSQTRSRRLVAGALALVVAAAGSYVASSAFRERSPFAPIAPPQPTAVPDVAVVICDGRSITIQVGTVAAREDGVHVEVINTSDRTLAFNASDTDEFHDVPPGTSTFVESLFFNPGPHFVACGPGGRLAGAFTGEQIHVVDPDHVWIPFDLVCPGSEQWGSRVSSEGFSDPIDLARTVLGDHVQPGDRFQLAGYPDSPHRRVVLLSRDGKAIAEAWLEGSDQAWFARSINGCR